MAVSIPLTQDKAALVDDEDADLASWGWCAAKLRKTFYAQRHIYRDDGVRTSQLLHRVIGARMSIEGEVDHRDRNGLNCTRKNLRAATASQNKANQALQSNNTSGVKGVSWNKRDCKWQAKIVVNGKAKAVGTFNDLGLAEVAVQRARERAFGEYACHG